MSKPFILKPSTLTLADCVDLIQTQRSCQLDPQAIAPIEAADTSVPT